MNLRKLNDYFIGFDLGTGSVGWAIITPDGELARFKGKPAWGSRVFPTADTAADTRLKRGQRRRYERRRWRLGFVQDFFREEIDRVDPDFFNRLNQSRLIPKDRGFHSPLFNDSDFSEKDYYDRFPAMPFLRAWLMTTDERADIRLIYLAFHNIVKHRGNFLQQDNKRLSAQTVKTDDAVEKLAEELSARCEAMEYRVSINQPVIVEALKDGSLSRSNKADRIGSAVNASEAELKNLGKTLGKALVGYVVDFTKVLLLDDIELEKAALNNDEKVDAILTNLPDDCLPLFNAIVEVYSSHILMGILRLNEGEIKTGALSGMDGHTLSFCQAREYEKYGTELALLKKLVKKYRPDAYGEFFRGDRYEGTTIYNKQTVKGYTKYNEVRKTGYEDFAKEVKKLFEGTGAATDPGYLEMMQSFEERTFLRRQKTSDNGSIPYQLHLEEMLAIIDNQGKYYPFLLQKRDEIASLVSFRIPYYVGPLSNVNAALDAQGRPRFSWATRRDGMEGTPIRPWNWEQVIDKSKTAQDFIMRMTSDCTYLYGQPVLPRCSLLYEEFCVLNELNGAWFTEDGDTRVRFDAYSDRAGIVEDLFKDKRKVKFIDVANWMQRNGCAGPTIRVGGGQGEAGFESSLTSYRFFCKDVFHVDELDPAWIPMIEEIILWNTLFEDRKILKEEIEQKYRDVLTAEQIKVICKKRFSGWGKFSKRLLDGIKAKTDIGPKSIMDVLREGDPSVSGRTRPMVLMEILQDDELAFPRIIEEENLKSVPVDGRLQIDDLPGSPAIRRTINQAMRILDEIVGIVGKPPANIFVEVTRDDDKRTKGKRTRRRYEQVKEAVAALGTEYAELKREFKAQDKVAFDDTRLMLYFLQAGKCLYSGKPLDINRLSEYQVDHIIPQAYVKDDSIENKALVLAAENQNKTDHLLISPGVRKARGGYWAALHRAGMMGDKKYNNLMRARISDAKMKGFIARQLVETSQSVKLFQMMAVNHYPETAVIPVRASLSHELREAKGYHKCREINDYHHAHDALLAAEIGRFLLYRHSEVFNNRVGYEKKVRAYIEKMGVDSVRKGKKPGSTSFFISSFQKSGFDKETGEIFRDGWDADFECERIRKYLNYKQVFVTRMPLIDHGAFWKQTVYSPREAGKRLSIQLKNSLNASKYGGYSGEQFAYFYCYEAQDKNGKKSIQFSEVPVRVANAGNVDIESLARDHAALLASRNAPYVFSRVLRAKIPKQQLIEIDGCRLSVRGKEEVRCAAPIAFTQDETAEVMKLFDASSSKLTEHELDSLFEVICVRVNMYSNRLYSNLKLESRKNKFYLLNINQKIDILRSFISLSKGGSNSEDLRAIGGSKTSGQLKARFNIEMSKSGNFAFIDQSITGMFEKRTFVDEL